MRKKHQAWLAGPLLEAKWEPWAGRVQRGWGLGPVYRSGRGSADGVSYIGNLDILAALIIAAQLKHQCLHMAAQLSLRHTAYDLCHPGDREAEGQGGQMQERGGQVAGSREG